jgi:hypothetical protein
MRDYVYIWNDPDKQFIVASGIEFKDFRHSLNTQGGVMLIEHQSDVAVHDSQSGFDFVSTSSLPELMDENIYDWGNFTWVDYKSTACPPLTDIEISELLFFEHKVKPLSKVFLPSLDNQFMAYVHDDGWYLQLYYTNWEYVEHFINTTIPSSIGILNIPEMKLGNHGYWLQNGMVDIEEKTYAVDSILNRRL